MALLADLVLQRGDLALEVSLKVDDGETVAIVGPNGAGKSTLFRCLAGLSRLDEGRIELDGTVLDEPLSGRFVPAEQRNVGVVFQDYLLFPAMSALENVAFGMRARGVRAREARRIAGDWLARLGVDNIAGARTASLSGGQAQRVAIARALAAQSRLVLLDEPFAALDAASRTSIRADLLVLFAASPQPRLLISHDPADVAGLADRVIHLHAGRIIGDERK